ncbi:MAG: toll/interleukin-1 receptor domain-containing protein [Actinobacteria bacterium]|nr:toll/interleukin-1 receptor domain-containing protein [Actinomycetota bacterium]
MADRPERQGPSGSGHDVFISYSHAADDRLAPALQRGLERLGARWPRSQALRVFRDRTGLSADASLWGAIETALDGAGWFLLLASPDAARSPWVARELDHWLAANPATRLMVALTDGDWGWDPASGRAIGDAVPDRLLDAFEDEPRHVDLRWARSETDLDLHHARFRDAVAELAAPVHGITKDQLEGDFVVERRRVRTRTRLTIAALAVLALAASALAVVAWRQTTTARRQTERATAQSLLVQARLSAASRPDLAALYAAEAAALVDSPQTRSALMEAVNLDPLLDRVVPLEGERPLLVSRGGEYVVTADAAGLVVRSANDGTTVRTIDLEPGVRTSFSNPDAPATAVPALIPAPVGPSDEPPDVASLVSIDEIESTIAVVGVDGDGRSVTTYSLSTPSDAPEHTLLDGPVREIAWLAAARLLTVVANGDESHLVVLDTSTSPATIVSEPSDPGQGGCRLSVAPDAGRFVTKVLTESGEVWRVEGTDGETVAEVPAFDDRCASLTPDGAHLYRVTAGGVTTIPGRVPGEEPRQTEEVLPSLELVDLASTEVTWRLDPTTYRSFFEGAEFGNALIADDATVTSSADGRRLLVGIWMVGPAFGSDIVRLDPLGRTTFGWSTAPEPRTTALDASGTAFVRLTPAGVAHFATPLLDGLPCTDLLELTGRIPLVPDGDGGGWRPSCGDEREIRFVAADLEPAATVGYADPGLDHIGIVSPVQLLVVDTSDRTVRDLAASTSFPQALRDGLANTQELVVTPEHLIVVLGIGPTASAHTAYWFDLDSGDPVATAVFDSMVVDRRHERLVAIDDGRLVSVPLDAPDDGSPVPDVQVPTDASLALVDGSVLAITGSSGGAQLFDADLDPLDLDVDADESVVAASPDGGLIAVRSSNDVRVLRAGDGTTVAELPGDEAGSAWFVGDGIAVEFERDLEFHRFDGTSAVLMSSDPLNDRGPEIVGVVDDELIIGSGAHLKVDGDLAARACELAGRPLTADEWSAAATSGTPRLCR